MENNFWINIATVVISAMFGSGGVMALRAARKERAANTDLISTNVAEISQKVYKGIIDDLQKEMKMLKEEVFMLRQVVEKYKSKCEGCPMNNSIIHNAGSDVTPAPNND